MRCKAVVLRSGNTIDNVDVNRSSSFPEFLEVWKSQEERQLINIDRIAALYPDDYAEKEKSEESFNNFCKIMNY